MNPNDTMKNICTKYKIPQKNILPFHHYKPAKTDCNDVIKDQREKRKLQMSSLNRLSKRIVNSRSESVNKSPKYKDT